MTRTIEITVYTDEAQDYLTDEKLMEMARAAIVAAARETADAPGRIEVSATLEDEEGAA